MTMEEQKITLTHLNIRQSIVILLAKLIALDIVLTSLVIGIYWFLTVLESYLQIADTRTFLFLILLGVIGLIKIVLTVLVILQWLNEYYEITPLYIYHKKGIIFRKTQEYRIDQIRRIEIKDSFLGEIFNYATISIYDLRLNKSVDFYLIHNPTRYANILKQIKPTIEALEDHTRLPFLPQEIIRNEY
jgi:uncharacterized membrane protein YdbT with pleckstrin-like domain